MEHSGEAKQLYLTCELCTTSRSPPSASATAKALRVRDDVPTLPPPTSAKSVPRMPPPKLSTTPLRVSVSQHSTHTHIRRAHASELPTSPINSSPYKKRPNSSPPSAWGSLRAPTPKDVIGPRKRQKAFDAPPPLLDYLVVLDFEWTADNTKRMEPVAEITQFPSVVMKLLDTKQDIAYFAKTQRATTSTTAISLPDDLIAPSKEIIRQDACAISAFDTFVRPTFNPRLSLFSIKLTAISQEQVDAAPTIDIALQQYMKWLQNLDMVDDKGQSLGNWCFATWGDGDIMSTLRQELEYKHLDLPPCFNKWINLKSDSIFKKHYRREPRGGLRFCVESVGATWEGRAHNGLIDSINTAKIVRRMTQTGFRFTRSTRGLRKDGTPFGQKK